MARPLRLEFSGALYHVTSRGNCLNAIFTSDNDRTAFLQLFGAVCKQFNWLCYAYCLMDNHYHLLIETPEGNLSKGMRQLNGVYTQRFNRTHAQVGHVFQGRYKAILVDKAALLLETARHIVLNPVRVGEVPNAQDWAWSSYQATVGSIGRPVWLASSTLLETLGTSSEHAIDRFTQFVVEGLNQPAIWVHLRHQVYLGDTQFVERMQSLIDKSQSLDEVPLIQRRPPPKPLAVYEQQAGGDRNAAIVLAYASGGYTLKEIGHYFNLHYSTVSGIIRRSRS